jgi:hypothetical protein
LTDEFGSRRATVLRPALLCNPVSKNGSTIQHPRRHLVCYTITPREWVGRSVIVRNQFGRASLRVGRAQTLCVPSSKHELGVQSEGTTTLRGTWTFDFDTGVQGPQTGADVWWRQVDNVVRFLVPQNGATFAHLGTPDFDAISRQTLQTQTYTANPINGSNNGSNQLTPTAVIAIRNDTGRYTKLRIDTYGYNLRITWVTYS